MNEVFNLSRLEARNFKPQRDSIWISIGEPINLDGSEFKHIDSPALENCPRLNMQFWDLNRTIVDITNPIQKLHPPTALEAAQIVDFILDFPNHDVIVNCAAGISRSGAVASFCESVLKYKWATVKNRAYPNSHLYKLMLLYYQEPSNIVFYSASSVWRGHS